MQKLRGQGYGKNGFTLAELLIAVAIIAVLVAIALPLFFGAMDKAEEARDDANRRAVKAVVVNAILSDGKNQYTQAVMKDGNISSTEDTVVASYWMTSAFIAKNGEIYINDMIPFNTESDRGKINPNDELKFWMGWAYEKGYIYEWVDDGSKIGEVISESGIKPETETWVTEHGGAWLYFFVLTGTEVFDEFTIPEFPVEP